MMMTSTFDGNDDARWRMTPDQERRSSMIYCLVVWSTPHPHLGRHSRDIDDLRRWNHGINDDNDHDVTTMADGDDDHSRCR